MIEAGVGRWHKMAPFGTVIREMTVSHYLHYIDWQKVVETDKVLTA
jgi:hypothetical protein